MHWQQRNCHLHQQLLFVNLHFENVIANLLLTITLVWLLFFHVWQVVCPQKTSLRCAWHGNYVLKTKLTAAIWPQTNWVISGNHNNSISASCICNWPCRLCELYRAHLNRSSYRWDHCLETGLDGKFSGPLSVNDF